MPFEAIIAIALAGALIARPVAPLIGRWSGWVFAVLPLSLFVFLAAHIPQIGVEGVLLATHEWIPSLGIALGFRLDGFSLLFSLLITGIGTLVVIYAGSYFAEKPPAQAGRFLALILLFMTAMLGTVLSDDLIVMFVFWELTSLTSFMLIGFDSHKLEARKSALQSLLVTGGGGLALFAGILLIGLTLGTFSFTEVIARSDELIAGPYLVPIIILILAGAFTKSAQFPFHFWLPNAMAAPTPASAYLHSATMVKLGVFLLARFDGVFADVPAFGVTLVIFGMITMSIAAFEALRASGFKAVLAQSTVASLGILVMLIGLDGEVAVVATVGFIITHAFYKAALFFCAGTAIHATGESSLRKLGGLARFLPITAAAAVLASLSMAGLPPFVGFISKEYLFEAQLESNWNMVPVIVAVLVNAIMVGVAGVVSIRPFFLNRDRITSVHHGEKPGLLVGPLLLASAGILMGFFSQYAAQLLIAPAASALYGAPIDVSFALWHGLTPMLALSALVVTIGALILVFWDSIHIVLRRRRVLHGLFGDRGYQAVHDGILGFARASTRWLQNGDQNHYTAIVVATVVLVLAVGMLASEDGLALALSDDPFRISVIAVLAIAAVGAMSSIFARSLIAALVCVGIVGFASALLFMMNGAPDLALTQFAVETLLVIILSAILLRLPVRRHHTRSLTERRRDGFLAVAFSGVIFVAIVSMTAMPLDFRLSEYFGQTSYLEAYGRNVVNVILVDYRAIDTLGEIAVVAFATMAAWALLRSATAKPGKDGKG
ncbi:hydrogen gas-evolving membrane-bound hydrogenase subunit E [Pelagibacterium luteolum]|uniref:Multicomponent Na+:H+ antiporter subunit A n=1 Tax=Pelagibacterium luteolum TaxID=440168 RepID=A0A1G7TTN1_9HYPH|nr:hydrogen gas-evolving membrane-bound hydrogenase subunit E [Pelagibacterium luteolum]SDG38521.1 multicomponent Na+:H+ antiporter subunit A [Pelagibacterium luteolum]